MLPTVDTRGTNRQRKDLAARTNNIGLFAQQLAIYIETHHQPISAEAVSPGWPPPGQIASLQCASQRNG